MPPLADSLSYIDDNDDDDNDDDDYDDEGKYWDTAWKKTDNPWN